MRGAVWAGQGGGVVVRVDWAVEEIFNQVLVNMKESILK